MTAREPPPVESPPANLSDPATLAAVPDAPGVYSIYDSEGSLQFVGLSRRLRVSIQTHLEALPHVAKGARWGLLEEEERVASGRREGAGEAAGEATGEAAREGHGASPGPAPSTPSTPPTSAAAPHAPPPEPSSNVEVLRLRLFHIWRRWVDVAVQETGRLPPGNVKGQDGPWKRRSRAPENVERSGGGEAAGGAAPSPAAPAFGRYAREVRLTPGKGLENVTVSAEQLVEGLVGSHRLVAFLKGPARAPSCGFSRRAATALDLLGRTWFSCDVLDERHNPGAREAVKLVGSWPTLPQIYVDGQLLGGANIVEQAVASGELERMLEHRK